MKSDRLRTHRVELAAAYAKARRRHRGQAGAGARLQDATTALLKAEVKEHRPRRGRPPNPRPSNPDLFVSEARP
ncbi:hypothetical protein ASF27_01595 [Methylobacterium sp. Leaf102]|uniref:hypothetical protein n=1 Tax=Methylobacterium sp. Leaf102 TaxID=1736253 RepID=UPI000701F3E1|nr:hypothetical protein [Methylobacterium sp. Leaf102]KQP34282.1 hypothetical protein ASF27_01595 [Methylobacterium sp. Leaf102]